MVALDGPAIGIVSGSGIDLRAVLDREDERVSFEKVPGLRAGTVPGHPSEFVRGSVTADDGSEIPVVLQRGRLHPYEGLTFMEATEPLRVQKDWGVTAVILTNAVGGLRQGLCQGAFVAADVVHCWPYRPFDLCEEFATDFAVPGCDASGSTLWVHGPNYETPAEIHAMRQLGMTTVGMSAGPEVLRCRQLGLPVGVVACVTNLCGGGHSVNHEEVGVVAGKASPRLCALLRRTLQTRAIPPL